MSRRCAIDRCCYEDYYCGIRGHGARANFEITDFTTKLILAIFLGKM